MHKKNPKPSNNSKMRKVGDGKTFSKSRDGCLRWLLLSSFPIMRRNTAGCNNNRFMWTHEETKIFLGLSRVKTFKKKIRQETLISTRCHGCLFILCLVCNLVNFRPDMLRLRCAYRHLFTKLEEFLRSNGLMGTLLIRTSLVFFLGETFLEAVRSSQLLKTKHLRLIHDVRRRNAVGVQLLLVGSRLRRHGNVILRGSKDCTLVVHAISHVSRSVFIWGKCVVLGVKSSRSCWRSWNRFVQMLKYQKYGRSCPILVEKIPALWSH